MAATPRRASIGSIRSIAATLAPATQRRLDDRATEGSSPAGHRDLTIAHRRHFGVQVSGAALVSEAKSGKL